MHTRDTALAPSYDVISHPRPPVVSTEFTNEHLTYHHELHESKDIPGYPGTEGTFVTWDFGHH